MYPNTMLNEPSGFRSHPSKTGTTSWPVAKCVWACVEVLATTSSANASCAVFRPWTLDLSVLSQGFGLKAEGLRSKVEGLLLLRRAIALQMSSFGELRFELLIGHVVVGEPMTRHI